MSKAFTREDDTGDAVLPRRVLPLPPGVKNLLTPAGAKRLQDELTELVEVGRPALLAETGEAGARGADAKEELQRIDQRIAYLQESLRQAEVVTPPPLADAAARSVVRFGAAVTVKDAKGRESVYRIVGVDEADFSRDEVSWLSPIARALLNAKVGQRVPFRLPGGTSDLEIVRVDYA